MIFNIGDKVRFVDGVINPVSRQLHDTRTFTISEKSVKSGRKFFYQLEEVTGEFSAEVLIPDWFNPCFGFEVNDYSWARRNFEDADWGAEIDAMENLTNFYEEVDSPKIRTHIIVSKDSNNGMNDDTAQCPTFSVEVYVNDEMIAVEEIDQCTFWLGIWRITKKHYLANK